MSTSAKITAFFVEKGVVSEQQKEIYKYGFELLLADAINFIIMLGIGYFVGEILSSILYLLIFISLRSFSGGYHAKTHLRCHCCTIGAYIAFLVLNSMLLPDKMFIYVIGNFVASIPVVMLAPIQNVNRPLSEEVRNKNRRRAIGLFYSLAVMAIILCSCDLKAGVTISLTLWIVAICMIPAIKNYPILRRKKT